MSDLFARARTHALHRIASAPLRAWPHWHSFVEEVFPTDFYAEMRRRLPEPAAYVPLSTTGEVRSGDYEMRTGFLLQDAYLSRVSPETATFWSRVHGEVLDDELASLLLNRHAEQLAERWAREGGAAPEALRREMLLVCDRASDGVKVHTSDPRNVMTLLFYLPPDDSLRDCGTSLYLPKDRAFRCGGGPHHDFARFDRAWTAPYVPNSLLVFAKSDDTFHGVEPIRRADLRRDLMLFYLRR